MVTEENKAIDEAYIRQLVDDWVKAVRAKDINGIMSHHAKDMLAFDILPPLSHKGAEVYKELWEQCFPCFQGPIGYEIHDLKITAGSDVAFCHFFNRMSGTTTNGEEIDTWMRATVCFHKINGEWMVTHEHVSVPIDMETNKALFDLKP